MILVFAARVARRPVIAQSRSFAVDRLLQNLGNCQAQLFLFDLFQR
jgi:hypothetical protein